MPPWLTVLIGFSLFAGLMGAYLYWTISTEPSYEGDFRYQEAELIDVRVVPLPESLGDRATTSLIRPTIKEYVLVLPSGTESVLPLNAVLHLAIVGPSGLGY